MKKISGVMSVRTDVEEVEVPFEFEVKDSFDRNDDADLGSIFTMFLDNIELNIEELGEVTDV